MDSDNIILRQNDFPPLTNKGAPLDSDDFDDNFINVFKDLLSLAFTNDVAAYNASTTYDDTTEKFATYNSRTWQWINAAPGSGVTPAEGIYWTEVFPAIMAHQKNRDTILDEGGPNEVSASTIKAGLAAADATTDLSLQNKTGDGFKIDSSTGDGVDIPAATESYAGLLTATLYKVLIQQSGTNTGDQTLASLGAEDITNKKTALNDDNYSDDYYPSIKAVMDYISSYVQQETIAVICSELGADIAVTTTAGYFFARYDGSIVDIAADMITGPVGSSVQIDILKNGVSIIGTDYLTIDDGDTSSDDSAITPVLTTTTFVKGDKFTWDIKQIGSGTAGQDLQCSMQIKQS